MQLNNLYKLIKITINIALCIKINTINWLCYANVKNTLYNYVNYIQLCLIYHSVKIIFIILIMLIIIIIVKTNQNMLPLIPNKLRVCKLLLIILQLLLIIKLKFNNI